jgi:hypothetical protein
VLCCYSTLHRHRHGRRQTRRAAAYAAAPTDDSVDAARPGCFTRAVTIATPASTASTAANNECPHSATALLAGIDINDTGSHAARHTAGAAGRTLLRLGMQILYAASSGTVIDKEAARHNAPACQSALSQQPYCQHHRHQQQQTNKQNKKNKKQQH